MAEHDHRLQAKRLHVPLPEPVKEEEIHDSPLSDVQQPSPQGGDSAQRKDGPKLMFDITSDDGFHVRSESAEQAWKAVTDRVQDARTNARMRNLSFSGMTD